MAPPIVLAAVVALAAAPGAGGLPWAEVLTLLVLTGIAGIAWQLLARLRGIQERMSLLERLPEIRAELARLFEERGGLDLRRIEHVLIDLRDAQKRLDERLMQIVEAARVAHATAEPGAGPDHGGRTPYSERIVNRLIAMGYERIQIITPVEEIGPVFEQDGEILVEARLQGAVCKGRVRVREGTILGAELRSTHSMFP